MTSPTASVIVPAHNEERVIGRLLAALLVGADDPNGLEVVVVCNGCSDGTAALARRLAPNAHVVEIAEPSKHRALVEGDAVATVFPRLYVDADIEITAADISKLVAALAHPGIHAVAPERELVLERSARAVRSYYRVWERLQVVRDGLFGRGVVGLDADGHRRLADRPEVLGDDLYLHSRFAPHERRIVSGASSRVRGPLTLGDLIRRRTRAAQGNSQLDQVRAAPATTGATVRDLRRAVRLEPRLVPSVPIFLAVTALARMNRLRLGRAGRQIWLRDESSRS